MPVHENENIPFGKRVYTQTFKAVLDATVGRFSWVHLQFASESILQATCIVKQYKASSYTQPGKRTNSKNNRFE